ncbi:MAG: quercetin 2,3-dioxygenase [Rhodospirillaceae bacterium]|nr:quercetin 2,3-dioxygenase [Rhodospirillaceae bacterium]
MTNSNAEHTIAERSRDIVQITPGIPASDGDGVKLTRVVGTHDLDMVDPILMLDAFGSDQPGDYIGGFPDHPHRGFDTVTYLLAGKVRHKDNGGHEGIIESGGVQWMTAGRGVVHSEMPEQENGLLKGFQLWINLPASEKMCDPYYQEFPAEDLPVEDLTGGGTVKVIAGRTGQGTKGPVTIEATDPIYFDVDLLAGASFHQLIPPSHSGFVYVIDGSVAIGQDELDLPTEHLAVLGDGDAVAVTAGESGGRFLLIAGKRLDEPVARGGPFVMNTRQEILQAFQDFQTGNF